MLLTICDLNKIKWIINIKNDTSNDVIRHIILHKNELAVTYESIRTFSFMFIADRNNKSRMLFYRVLGLQEICFVLI